VTNRINAGCYVFRRRVIDEIPAGQVVSVERATFPALITAGQVVMGYPETAYWLDVGTPETFVRGSCDLVLGRLASAALPGPCGQALLLPGADLKPGAEALGGSVLGAGSRVGAGARVDGSVLFDGAVIGAGAVITGSVVGVSARVGEGVVVDGAVIGDGAHVAAGNELCGGLRLWPGSELGPTTIRFSSDC